jgi:predicted DNA-binding transcriptional regulator YafY
LAVRPALLRLAVIDEKLRSRSWPNASSLARELEVTPRTIHRDFDFLRDQLHAPIAFDSRKNGYYYSETSFRLPCVSVSEGECVALFLAERLLQQYRGTPFAGDITCLFNKVVNLLSEPITIKLEHLNEVLSFRHTATAIGDVERFAQLHRATRECRQLEIVYWTASRNETCRRVVDPYHMASVDGDWYLIAYCHRREDVLMFATPRIREVGETGNKFERPADFCINDYLDVGFRKVRGNGPLQTVRLRFSAHAACYVREKVWHPTQKLRSHADGTLTLTIRVNHLLEVKRWVLSFGADCEVRAPKELQAEIIAEIRKMLDRSGDALVPNARSITKENRDGK